MNTNTCGTLWQPDPWSRSRAVVKCLDSFQSLQAIPDEKCHLALGLLSVEMNMKPKITLAYRTTPY